MVSTFATLFVVEELKVAEGDSFLALLPFTIVATLFVLPLGMLGDRYGRKGILSCAVALWAAAAILIGLSQTFTQAIITVAISGIPFACVMGVGYAYMLDLVPPQRTAEFVGLSGRRLTHRWEYEDELVAEVPIAIDGPRWRAYSTKNLEAGRLGEWTVSVLDESGNVVRTDSFVYEAAAPAPEVVAPATPAALTTPATPADGEAPSETPASPAPAQP